MQYLEEFLEAADGHEIPVRFWRPRKVCQVLVIAHGMAEYCERYSAFADWLTEQDIAVVSLNHRGHGMDCELHELGYFSDTHGWQKVIDDLDSAILYARKELKNVPLTLMGHSMGSFIAQCYIQQKPMAVDNLILMSTNRINTLQVKVAQLIVNSIKLVKGGRAVSKLVDQLSFGSFNGHFKPNRTEFDWLSRDDAHVDAYMNDPYCGFLCSNQMWRDFLSGLASIDIDKWPTQLPIHLLSGANDPVGEMSKGITKLKEKIVKSGLKLSSFKLYSEARHELINEINYEEVWHDIRSIVLSSKIS